MMKKIWHSLAWLGLSVVLAGMGMVASALWLETRDETSFSLEMTRLLDKFAPIVFWEQNRRENWLAGSGQHEVWGYIDRHSVRAGESFDLMLAVTPKRPAKNGHVEAFRVDIADGRDQPPTWKSDLVDIGRQPVPASASSLGPNWSPTVANISTTGWPRGVYSFDFITADSPGSTTSSRRFQDIAFLLVNDDQAIADVVVMLGTNTYQAYNEFGGHSLYFGRSGGRSGQMVSFDRPVAADFRIETGENTFFRWEVHLAHWLSRLAEEQGFTVDYVSNFDVHRTSAFTDQARLFVVAGHNEYWSKEEFDHVEQRIFQRGGHTLFLGANIAYWQVRYTDVNQAPGEPFQGRQMVAFKSADEPLRWATDESMRSHWTARFREDARRPETMLMGVGWQNWFQIIDESQPRYPYLVVDDGLPYFEGTGWQSGDAIGDLVGFEWDSVDPEGDGQRLWDQNRSLNQQLPAEDIRVLFRGHPTDVKGQPGVAEAVYFESQAGANVFSAGSLRWPWGFDKPGFESDGFRRFHRNLFLDLLANPNLVPPEPSLGDGEPSLGDGG